MQGSFVCEESFGAWLLTRIGHEEFSTCVAFVDGMLASDSKHHDMA